MLIMPVAMMVIGTAPDAATYAVAAFLFGHRASMAHACIGIGRWRQKPFPNSGNRTWISEKMKGK